MSTHDDYRGGENFNLRSALKLGRTTRLEQRAEFMSRILSQMSADGELLTLRELTSPTGRAVTIVDGSGGQREMLMFGSNDYLGLAEHPAVAEAACRAARDYGVGVGGPPLLNGYTRLHRELEERLAALKCAESALIFPSGYSANVGLVSGLAGQGDTVVYDAYSHASFSDGLRLSGARSASFRHNDMAALQRHLESIESARDVYVGIEGVYSMDGDLAPLESIVPLCRNHGAILLLDDAHGTGALGATGRGSAEERGVEGQVDLTMGTFSKTFGVVGGFVAGNAKVIDYLRYFARSYMFSASLPPIVVAAVLGGLNVIEAEPWRIVRLRENTRRATERLRGLGFELGGQSQIIPLRVPAGMDMRIAARQFHESGVFLNSIEYPAVPLHEQRFRISIMATHTDEDIDRLAEVVARVWDEQRETVEARAAA